MNSWPMTPTAAPRATRATSGTVATTSAITTAPRPAPAIGRHGEPDQDRREGQHHVDQAHDPAVGARIVGGQDAEHAAQQAADDDADQAQHQRVARAEDDAAQDVAAGIVGAEPVLRRWAAASPW